MKCIRRRLTSDAFLKFKEKRAKMKRNVGILMIILALTILSVMMVGCVDNNTPQEPVYQDYTVSITDGVGNPMSNVMVKFTTPSGDTKTRVTDKTGIVSLKNVIAGEYKILVEQGYSDAIITNGMFTLTAEVTSLNLVVRDETKSMDIYGNIPDGSWASMIGATEYNIPCQAGMTTYYVFTAQTKGVYKFSVDSSDADMILAYCGMPMFVQDHHIEDGEYDGKSFEITVQDTATPYVICISATKDCVANLNVERTGDAPFDPNYAPWTVVTPAAAVEKFNLPAGTVLKDIDVTDPGVSVSLGEDGYYYTSDGKMVYVRLGSAPAEKYLDVSVAFICGLVDENFGQNFGGYVYDENGKFVGKYSYNSLIEEYYNNCDATGVYPLTAELAEAIQCHGNSIGWWKMGTANYLFDGVAVVKGNEWLFLCCTVAN